MNEVEIINYLKCNMSNGIAFRFMPVEVRNWVVNHLDDCTFLTAEGIWDKACRFFYGELAPAAFNVFGLLASYKPKSEKKESGEWVEFEVTPKGTFFLQYTKDNGSEVSHVFHWSQWAEFLYYCWVDDDLKQYTAFGGWQYEEDKDFWYMEPQLIDEEGNYRGISNSMEKVTPIIPKKIRFWRKQ